MDPRHYIAETGRALGFLSRLPMPASLFAMPDYRVATSVTAFPAAGFVVALPSAVLVALLGWGDTDPLLTALLALLLLVLLTGALHEDGLADCADGLLGGHDRERRLAIMKDSRIGAYGALALLFSLGLRAAALAALLRHEPAAAALALPAAAALSRAVMVRHWFRLPAARVTGAAAAAGQPTRADMRSALLIGAGLFLLLALAGCGLWPGLTALAIVAAASIAFTRAVRAMLGGHTGDTIGAAQQVAEIAALAALATLM